MIRLLRQLPDLPDKPVFFSLSRGKQAKKISFHKKAFHFAEGLTSIYFYPVKHPP